MNLLLQGPFEIRCTNFSLHEEYNDKFPSQISEYQTRSVHQFRRRIDAMIGLYDFL